MLEYTLFGDPALQMAIANGEIQPTVETKTVAPGDTLRIAPGHILDANYDASSQTKRFAKNTDFDGTLAVKAVFPGKTAVSQGVAGPVEYYTGDVILTQTLSVNRGVYPAVTFTVPQNIASGDAHVEYYAQSDATVAVGGDGFTVNVPKILDIRPELVGDLTENATPTSSSKARVPGQKFRISVKVSDESEQSLLVVLEWRNLATRKLETVRLVQQGKDGWWTTPEPLDAPTDGSAIRYEIQVTDSDGNIAKSNRLEYYPYVYPNLSVVQVQRSDMIRYGYNLERKQWFLAADVQVEGTDVETPVEISFFYGNPDVDEDMLVDSDATLLGSARIQPSDWLQRTPLVNSGDAYDRKQVYEPDPLNTLPIATGTLNLRDPLRPGIHDIFVYIDATETEADRPGEIVENDEEDNIAYRRISVDMGAVDATASVQIISVDRNCVVTVPPGTFQDMTVLAVRALDAQRFAAIGSETSSAGSTQPITVNTIAGVNGNEQPKRAPLPGVSVYGYELAISGQHNGDWLMVNDYKLRGLSYQQPTTNNQQPFVIDLNFDYGVLRTQLAEEVLGSSEEVAGGLDVTGTLDTAVVARTREMGVYMFNSTLGYWTRLPSQHLTDASGTLRRRIHVTNVNAENVGKGQLRDVHIQPEGARIGKYVLFFTGPRTYRVFHSPFVDRADDPENLGELEVISLAEQLSSFSINYPNWTHGFALDMEQRFENPFVFGDVWTFNVTALPRTLEGGTNLEDPLQQELQWYVTGFGDTNRGTGTISYIEVHRLETDASTNMPEDHWIVFFLTDTEFQIEGKRTGVLRSATDGTPLRGTVGQPFFYEPYGLRLQLTQGESPFTPGDRFRFETRPVGTIRATTDRLGPITFIYSDDTVPPDIQLTIGNQQHFVPGDATDPEPLIGATVTDLSGLDYLTRPLLLELGRVSGEYERIAPEAYQLMHQPGSNQLVLTYPSPELEPREYELRLTASDVHGNTDTKRITFRVHDNLQLLSFLNYPNPFPRKTTLTCELTAPADSLVVKIYTLSGRMIRELSIPATPGFLMVEWDGRDAEGVEVANGVYYAKLKIKREGEEDITEILKMMKLR